MSHSVPDKEALTSVWEAVKNRSIPVKALTKAEYDVLDESQKNADILYIVKHINDVLFFYNGEEVDERITMEDIEQAIQTAIANLDDGVPTGAVVSFMALSAPVGYLICDGSIYNVSTYQKLASYIKSQFGSLNYFGGNGTTTFAVPDMRNLFLRGYHGSSTEKLSGDIGEKQDATVHPHIPTTQNSVIGFVGVEVSLYDTGIKNNVAYRSGSGSSSTVMTNYPKAYTSRPVNMAVLFCIKT